MEKLIGKRGLAITLIWLRSFVKTILSFFMSNRGIPKTILEIYSSNSIIDRAYLNIRWRLCPFQKIEALIPQEGLIIDIGCGYGLLSNLIALKSHKRNVVGIDSSETRILTAQKTVKDRKNIKFLKQDIFL
ncbi:MAG: class I SAM-dependent methyltransferase [Nitrospinae bacterium]|nr:class I SAM-dependent methyltransferase [Nitrospinota bacterium]